MISEEYKIPKGVTEEEKRAEEGAATGAEDFGKSERELRRKAQEAEAGRDERFRDNFEIIAIVSLWLAWGAIVLIGFAWLYHILAPPMLPRLPPEQEGSLQSILTGGVIVGIAGGHIKRRLNN